MYIDQNSPSWVAVDMDILQINHALRTTQLKVSATLIQSLTVDIVLPFQIEAMNFLKYVDVARKDQSQIINFYENLVTKPIAHNIFITPSDYITPSL